MSTTTEAVRSFLFDQLVYVGFNNTLNGRFHTNEKDTMREIVFEQRAGQRFFDTKVRDATEFLLRHKDDVKKYVELTNYLNEHIRDPPASLVESCKQKIKLRRMFYSVLGLPIWDTIDECGEDTFENEILSEFLFKLQHLPEFV